MFYALRKLIIGVIILFWTWTNFYAYQHLDRFGFVYDQYEARYLLPKQREAEAKERLRIQADDARKIIAATRAKVSRIGDGLTLLVYESANSSYQVGLVGTKFPRWANINAEAKKFLNDLLSQKTVNLEFTLLAPNRTGMVIMYLGDTNVNEFVIASGMAGVDFKQLDRLPSEHQKRFVAAAIKARDERAGMWRE